MDISNKLLTFYHKIRKNQLLRPIPSIFFLIAVLFVIYWVTWLFPEIYALLELSEKNPFSPITSIFIHNTHDQGQHLISNVIVLVLFAYIVSIQTSAKKTLIVFIITGTLTNLCVIIFVRILNMILLPKFIYWSTYNELNIGEIYQLYPLGGGGTSDAISGLIGFSIAFSFYFFFVNEAQASYIQDEKKQSIKSFLNRLSFKKSFVIVNIIAFLGIFLLCVQFLLDIEMFSYNLMSPFVNATGLFLQNSTLEEHLVSPYLAHTIGALIGLIIGLMYLVLNECNNIKN